MTYVTYTVGAKCILNLSDRDGATQSRHRPKHVLSDLTHGAFRTLKRRSPVITQMLVNTKLATKQKSIVCIVTKPDL